MRALPPLGAFLAWRFFEVRFESSFILSSGIFF